MFDFEKLDLYQELKKVNLLVYQTLRELDNLDPFIVDQWKRASLASVLHLAEGTSRMSPTEKKLYYANARAAIFECVAILDMVHSMADIDKALYELFYAGYEKVSKMLLGMYRSQG